MPAANPLHRPPRAYFSGLSLLASSNPAIRKFWVDHCIACRHLGEYFGRALGSPCVTDIWIPDGMKDIPIDRKTPRLPLRQSLDEILAEPIDRRYNLDAVESNHKSGSGSSRKKILGEDSSSHLITSGSRARSS